MPKFEFEPYLANIEKYAISSLSFVPPIAVLFAKSHLMKKYNLSSVKYCLVGGAPLGEKLQVEAELAINSSGTVRIRQAWGMGLYMRPFAFLTNFPRRSKRSHDGCYMVDPRRSLFNRRR